MKFIKKGTLKVKDYKKRKDGSYLVFKGSMTFEEVETFVTKLSKDLHSKGIRGHMEVGIRSNLFDWKAGQFTEIGKEISIWNPSVVYRGDIDWESLENFQKCRVKEVFVTYFREPNAGGTSEYNDCLYDCLKDGFIGSNVFLSKFSHPWKFKKFLNLDRKDKVPIDCMEEIENQFKNIAINVTGDYLFTSSKSLDKIERVLNIKLRNGHYMLIHDDQRTIPRGLSFNPRKVLVRYNKTKNEPIDKVYNGKKFYEQAHESFLEDSMKNNYIYLFCKSDDEDTMKQMYNEFKIKADELMKASNNKINLYRANGGAETIIAKKLFYDYTRHIKAGDKMREVESLWNESCYKGGLMFCDEQYIGKGYDYDIVSAYLSILVQPIDLPIFQGEFLKAKDADIEKYFKYGIYRCTVKPTKEYENLVKINSRNYYTSYDLMFYKQLGSEIKLIHDSQPNFLYYAPEKRIRSETMFKAVVEYLFEMKKNNVQGVKGIMTKIWGICCEKKKYNLIFDNKGDGVTLSDNLIIDKIIPINIDKEEFEMFYHEEDNIYCGEYPRIKAFITSYCRVMIGKIMQPHIKDVVRCQTDGFITKRKIEFDNMGSELGQLKYKGKNNNIEIKHINLIVDQEGKKAVFI